MGGGGYERVVPTLVGVIAFLLLLSFFVNLSGGSIGSSNPAFKFTETYVSWSPSKHIITSANVSDHYVGTAMPFTKSGKNNVNLYVIRDSTQYRPGSDKPWERYKDYIIFDQKGGFLNLFTEQSSISYSALNQQANTSDSNSARFDFTLWGENYTAFISTGPAGGKTDSSAFTTNLWANRFNVSLTQVVPPETPNFWTVTWWLLSFNAAWIPTFPVIAWLTSAVIDVILLLCAVRLAQGFIP